MTPHTTPHDDTPEDRSRTHGRRSTDVHDDAAAAATSARRMHDRYDRRAVPARRAAEHDPDDLVANIEVLQKAGSLLTRWKIGAALLALFSFFGGKFVSTSDRIDANVAAIALLARADSVQREEARAVRTAIVTGFTVIGRALCSDRTPERARDIGLPCPILAQGLPWPLFPGGTQTAARDGTAVTATLVFLSAHREAADPAHPP